MIDPHKTRKGGDRKIVKTEGQIVMAAAGLSIAYVARKAGLRPRTVEIYLRNGCDCLYTAERLSRIIGCRIEAFLHPRTVGRPSNRVSVQAAPLRETLARPAKSVRNEHLRLVTYAD